MFFADDTNTMRTTITMHPSRFLQLCGVRFGLRFALSKAPGNIEHALQAYRAVPDNAIIFKLCWEGRIDAINLLFEQGLASPLDTDSYGQTPLMIAAVAGELETCKFLMEQGADVEVRNGRGENLVMYAIDAAAMPGHWLGPGPGRGWGPRSEYDIDVSDAEKSARVPCESRFEMLKLITQNACPADSCRHEPNRLALFCWAFTLVREELHSNGGIDSIWLKDAIYHEDIDTVDYILKSGGHGVMDIATKHTILFTVSSRMKISDQTHLIHCAMSHGFNLHQPLMFFVNPDYGFPTTMAMQALRSSAAFSRFRTTLQLLGINKTTFVHNEIQQSPAVADGWTIDSLQIVFDLVYIPIKYPPNFLCWEEECMHDTEYMYDTAHEAEEVSWNFMLDKLKELNIGDALASNVDAILREREVDIIKFRDVDGRVCSNCGEVGRYYATGDEYDEAYSDWIGHWYRLKKEAETKEAEKAEVEDSMFLLSL
ncbi:hypothetical protein SBOR_8246 [Sclerotinia borealis F-4128]|uniref:Uncharacterized protein n=1 Tax=Sclerotinia borealis (strain F-4128) TaxID=1432307 RepID=W9C3N9_SCLBF|nr:hypothetical protein SBOR_8246 [Sclerotinia borealis F-4128]